jgi:hypothetical protein
LAKMNPITSKLAAIIELLVIRDVFGVIRLTDHASKHRLTMFAKSPKGALCPRGAASANQIASAMNTPCSTKSVGNTCQGDRLEKTEISIAMIPITSRHISTPA